MGTNAHDIWNFVRSVCGKTCIIDCYSVMYAQTRCAVVCFDSAELLNAAVRTTPVLKNANLCWFCLISTKYTKCEKLGHMSLGCVVGGKFSSGNLSCRAFSNTDKSRLAAIYAKHSAPVACPVSFGGLSWAKVARRSFFPPLSSQNVLVNDSSSLEMKPSLLVTMEVNNRFAALEHSLASLAEQVSKLVKRLDTLGPMVPQPSPGYVVMSEGLDVSTSSGTVVGAVFFDMSSVSKLEDSMKCLIKTYRCTFGVPIPHSMSSLVWKFAMCNVKGMNNPFKQKDIIRWHKKINNLVSIITETKLKGKICPWIADKFDSVRVFTSGLDFGHLDADVAVIMDVSLTCHVCKISEVPSRFLSVKLLFKDKLSVLILGLYAGAFLAVRFSQAGEVNSLIAKTVNESSFIVLSGDFNKDGSHKCTSFRKCLDLGLANSLAGSPAVKLPTWTNFKGVRKMIDYVMVSSTLVNAIVYRSVSDVGEHFEIDHQAVSVSLSLGGLLDGAMAVNATMFSDDFIAFQRFSDLDMMWNIVHKIIVFSADEMFKKKWFKNFDGVFTRESSKFHKLELLISKLVKAFRSICCDEFISLLDVWSSLNVDNASVVRSLFLSGSSLNTVQSALSKVKKTYCSLKMAESKRVEESHVKSAINKKMESFKLNKGYTIQNVLKRPFYKVILDHLVVDNELILEPGSVKSKWMKSWKDRLESIEWFPMSLMEAWVSMILKPYEWKGVFTNTRPITLIEITWKILSKILSDKIMLVCSAHDILCEDNFSVLKGTTTQTPIFAIGLVDMRKVYNSVGWEHLEKCLVRIKMCGEFICFFGNIHRNQTNQVITDFSLTDGYSVHDKLDQGEVFSSLFWCIFYDPLLCEVKHQESVYRYRLNSHFISWSGCAESQTEFSTFFAAEAFVNDTIWISNLSLFISGSPISIAKKDKSHQYFGIFLLTDGLSKFSLAKVHLDVHFFSNLVLKKVVLDKQFLYLVSAVFQPIVSYRMQFSFVPVSVCDKWDALIRKSLKLKSGFSLNFPSNTIHHPFFYGLKSFSQCQSESKVASLISFANSCEVLGQLFSHRSHDLQVLCWHLIHLLSSPACIQICVSNNFLSGLICILLECNLSLDGSLVSSFRFRDGVSISAVLGEFLFFKYLLSLWHYGIAFVDQLWDCHRDIFDWYTFKWWKKLDPRGPISEWFGCSVVFFSGVPPSPLALSSVGPVDICGSDNFVSVCDCLSWVDTDSLSVYMDGSVKNLGIISCRAGTAAFFENVNLGLGVCVQGLISSTLVELQAIVLALECISVDCSVCLFSDSQAALNACKSEVNLVYPDFCNRCWVKGHSSVLENDCTDSIADTAALSDWFLPPRIAKWFLLVDGSIVSDNSRHFVQDVFCAVSSDLHSDVDWLIFFRVWHPDLHMATGFTSRCTANIYTYLMKALHYWLLIAVEVSDHVFSCMIDDKVLSGLFLPFSSILQMLLTCALDFLVFLALCKSFVFKGWLQETVSIFHNPRVAGIKIADFVCSICIAFRNDIWLNSLIPVDGSVLVSVSGLASRFSNGVVKLLSITEAFGIRFGFHKSCSFFSGIGDSVTINIIA
ncbi:hypothetical protein G9A89_004867 [Geosiphon pyriformis]|nr:hypothetical protein G9A89_004867 [Geosiphon pyriformis]